MNATTEHLSIPPLVRFIRSGMQTNADPGRAVEMQRYMKTTQPFYGVPTPLRKEIFRQGRKAAPLTCRADYEAAVRALWSGTFREEMYMALEVAGGFKRFHSEESWPLYQELVATATHWDTLDWLASRIVGPLVQRNRALERDLVAWSDSPNLWVRRASLLAHLKHKKDTNTELLAATILKLAGDRDFFIRKAIGWVLRDYSYTNPAWVAVFVREHKDSLSGLSRREALKQLQRQAAQVRDAGGSPWCNRPLGEDEILRLWQEKQNGQNKPPSSDP